MMQMKGRLVTKPRLSDFRALVLLHTVVLLPLTHSVRGQSQVIGASQPIVAMVGDDIILPCHLEPAEDASDLTVEWTRPDLNPTIVHLRRDGEEILLEKHPSFMERTSLSSSKLTCGDVSLKLSKVKLSDAGTYRCLIPTSGAESLVEVAVGCVSSAELKISKVNSGMLLQCESKGWYPEPEVLWQDAEGNLLSAGPPETVRGPDDLYTVSSRVTVEKRHGNNFTCRVQQKNINQIRETHINVPDDLFMVQASTAVRITITLAVGVMSVVSVFFVLWAGTRNKIKTTNNSRELQPLMEEESQRLKTLTGREKMKDLEKTKAKLDEELQRKEEERQHVEQVITTLTNQKKALKDQKDKLISLQQEEKTLIKEIERALKDSFFSTNKPKDRLNQIKQHLKTANTEHERLMKNTEELLETTEDMIIKMTERKAMLERDKEQIHKHLKETEGQREETERERRLQSEQQEKIHQ